mmetsp:Transcript_4704/g.7081  ORF Transcript_4704/g.7081 Transcript_4704/m.7081 type:complete len:192 (-) Transcript_4704:1109-1684(-)
MEGEQEVPSLSEKVFAQLGRRYQHLLDRSTVYLKTRWITLAVLLVLYLIRVYLLNGWFIITYGLGIFLLNLFIGFLSPQIDPETDGPLLPTGKGGEEFRPFSRRVPEFKFWQSSTRAVLFAIGCTFFKFLDIPVFWPILLIYFIALFVLTMRRQIAHMIKHKYVPWSWGKTKYETKDQLNAPGSKPKGIAL